MVLLVIDTQNLITNDKLYKFDTFVSNVKEIINKARKNNIEVIYVRHDDGEGSELTKGIDGFEIYEEFQPINGEKIFDKNVNSAFKGTGLLEYLRKKDEKEIIIVGLQTDYCFDATIKCGFEHGFHMIVPAYSNTTVNNKFMSAEQSYRYHNEFMWNGRYAECISFDETIKRMK
ncbi:peroxyureidoacrylate/ureidoacrylate amidohydrolase RutB [Clostridium saccharobutylicum]|uniref:cysteine hydrolase family protein n=1 Tax=Clostridium saccharobutylicum TaxID=169679 RepID=UPI00098390C1|nr:cysteine hydrolase family protein [Clostridium saccharobutylicum]AQS10324.1 peroxyureidoacrylate/ureidoacrylate amidohydrolase RutB [Clostridium saccharobutylicum]MBC2438694.1 cysteine hydrolase [Clostridium saccharobutylicum]NSB87721.1 nicotinamidase-related amidase [Clostridium saccharobutylicum]NYC31261.1 nicotinamidase-related amidase [Clostridium saccharobutylicum]OOM19186.1 peroxyureidoacrylate/ureidoacrylate amidohydrolase RutB [Clostridium saccharobutylicum]